MSIVDRKSLVEGLDEACRLALEAAARRARDATHYNIEIEHFLQALLDQPGDLTHMLKYSGIDHDRAARELTRALETFRVGCTRLPDLPPGIMSLLREAWLVASLRFGERSVRSGHVLLALLGDERISAQLRDSVPALRGLDAERLRENFSEATAGSIEAPVGGGAKGSSEKGAAAGGALARFTTDLVERAKAGKIDPVLGREAEIRQAADILLRRRQNNPILTGEAGVGKTAVVEGLALRIAAGDVPPALCGVELRTLDLALLQAGASAKGEFESRLKAVIDETNASPRPVILFIDEAHTLIGAGGQAGQNDAANLLKPALARGELRTIAATTWAEYKKYFEKDAALSRRFQVIKVDEPAEPLATAMLRGVAGVLEAHHKVRILEEAMAEAVRLSARFIPARQLPDKAISLLDTACARVAMSQVANPPQIEDRQLRLNIVATERRILRREAATGGGNAERDAVLASEEADLQAALKDDMRRLEKERGLVKQIVALRDTLDHDDAPIDAADKRAELARLSGELAALQGETPLVFPVVDGQAVAEVVHDWTGIPAGRMRSSEIRTVLGLRNAMAERIIGQDYALDAVAKAMHTNRARLTDPRKPIGVFLMVGTSGTGKTETALALADLLYGGEQSLTVINMSEFKEEHKVSLLMGSPPGYVGYGEGGILTEAVRRRPYSVILLDEVEKAHPGVQDVFYQVFDKGSMKDGEGRDIDFRNTVIIMTSNAGTEMITGLFADRSRAPDAAGLADALQPELMRYFKPAFLARTTLVPYLPLGDEAIRRIAAIQLGRIARRVGETYQATFEWRPEVEAAITARCVESSAGARNIEHILSRTLLPQLSAAILTRIAEGQSLHKIVVDVDEKGTLRYSID
jgi:type VI secretion system protein VasG